MRQPAVSLPRRNAIVALAENGAPDFTALQAALPVSVRFRPSSRGEQYRRGGLDPVQDARTGCADAHAQIAS
jgi:hypothetical protein